MVWVVGGVGDVGDVGGVGGVCVQVHRRPRRMWRLAKLVAVSLGKPPWPSVGPRLKGRWTRQGRWTRHRNPSSPSRQACKGGEPS